MNQGLTTELLLLMRCGAAAGTWNDNFGETLADNVCVAGGVVTDMKCD
jgi:hypothetical protein